MAPSRRVLTLALIAVVSVACGGRHREQTEPIADIPLKVTNRNWVDIVIYVVHDGQRTRIGTVTSATAHEFVLPARLLGQAHELALIGEAIGSRGIARTETLIIHPGQYIEWTLEIDLRRSTVGVY
jgi:hypothetical protein